MPASPSVRAPSAPAGGSTPGRATRSAAALLLLALGGLARAEGAASAPADGGPLWVELSSPLEQATLSGPVALAEVRGRAGAGPSSPVDLAIALDASVSTLYPSGRDIDSDGITAELTRGGPLRPTGEYRPVAAWTTDSDDTVMSAEIDATWRLLRTLESGSTRAGLLTFAGRPRIRAELGAPGAVRAELARLRPRLQQDGTDLGAAVRAGVRMLSSASPDDAGHRRILVVLSDGEATAPSPELYARRSALRAADQAREAGVRIFAFALGGDEDGADLLAELAQRTGGSFCEVEHVGDVVEHLPHVRFAGIAAIELENRTAGRPGRATRLFADGSFDGFVPLVPGVNRIAITARARSGEQLRIERDVSFESRPATTDADLADLAASSRALEERALESDFAERVRASERTRTLRIRPER